MIICVYGPTKDSDKLSFLNKLRTLRTTTDYQWMILGDFNIIRNLQETTGGHRNIGHILEFNHLINDLNLIDVPLQGRSFTWSNKRPTLKFSRPVRALLSNYWALGVTHTLTDLPNTTSDHAPLLLSIKSTVCPKNKCFRFEKFWLNYEETTDIVAHTWSSGIFSLNPTQHFKNKLWST
jgi:hypothetical protein